MRSCDSRKKHALPAASPSSNASTLGDSGWQKNPIQEVCFPFDVMLQSKNLERDAKHLVVLRRATHTTKHPSNTQIGRVGRQKHKLCTGHNAVIQVTCSTPPRRCWFLNFGRDVSTSRNLSHFPPKGLPPSHHRAL